MKILFFLGLAILFLGTIFLEPTSHYLTLNEAGFPIEELTYLPEGYANVAESEYFKLKRDVPALNYIETKFGAETSYFKFRQAENSDAFNRYLEAMEAGQTYSQEKFNLGETVATLAYFRDGTRHYVWVKGKKRYEIVTNDYYLSPTEVVRMVDGLKPALIDFGRPVRQAQAELTAFGDWVLQLISRPTP